MNSENKVKQVAKNLVVAYAHHIKDRVVKADLRYITSGIDTSFERYEKLFKHVLSKTLGVESTLSLSLDDSILAECVAVLDTVIITEGYKDFLSDTYVSECTYDICVHILATVAKDEFYSEFSR
jgi:hypothetical protein